MQDQRSKFQVRVGDAALWVIEADEVVHDVLRPLETPNVMFTVSVEVKPNSTCTLSRGVGVTEVSS